MLYRGNNFDFSFFQSREQCFYETHRQLCSSAHCLTAGTRSPGSRCRGSTWFQSPERTSRRRDKCNEFWCTGKRSTPPLRHWELTWAASSWTNLEHHINKSVLMVEDQGGVGEQLDKRAKQAMNTGLYYWFFHIDSKCGKNCWIKYLFWKLRLNILGRIFKSGFFQFVPVSYLS